MKKVLVIGMVFGALALTSCKKDYTCTYDFGGEDKVVEYPNLKKDAKEAAESQCKLLDGTFSAK